MITNTYSFAFPSILTPESEKKEDYHKQYVQAIVYRSMKDGYNDRVAIANECVNFYLALQAGKELDFLTKAEDGDTLPAIWQTYSRIQNKINILVGELIKKRYDINVFGLNKELTSRKLKEREKTRIEFRFQPIAQEIGEETGVPLQGPQLPGAQPGFEPETEEDIDDFYDNDYKDIAEIVIKAILKDLIKRNGWDYQRIAMFRDVLIQGMGFCRTEIIDGIPCSKRVDPRNMIWDTNATDDFLSDATFFGEVEYMSVGDVIDQFGLSKKELEEAYQQSSTWQNSTFFQGTTNDFALLGNTGNLALYKQEAGELRILVCRAVWVDYKKYSNKISKDKYGQEHIKRVTEEQNSDDVKHTIIKTWRRGTLIGGKFMKKWGEIPNQARNWSDLSYCDPPYKAVIPNYYNGVVVSKVHMMKNLQRLKDIALYRLQLDMARSGGKAFFYDITQLPPGMTLQQVLKYFKTVGVIPIDPTASGNPTGFNQFKEIDLTISNNITAYLEISAMIDREMDAMSGINEARQGQVKNASQAVGVTQSSLFQSSLSTEVYYDLFTQFCSKVLTMQAKLAKIAWAGKERFETIIGSSGVDFLTMDVDMDLHDYAIYIEEVPELIQDKQSFQQIVLAALQAGQVTFPQAISLMLEKDIQAGVRKLERDTKKYLEDQQAQQEAMMQQEQQQMAMQQQQADADRQAMVAGQQAGYQNALKQTLVKGRMDMREKLIDFRKDVTLAKMQKELEKQKAAAQKSGTR